jgi:hypothetical protein
MQQTQSARKAKKKHGATHFLDEMIGKWNPSCKIPVPAIKKCWQHISGSQLF